jgi:hypothetical protein
MPLNLNPVEGAWANIKGGLGNLAATDADQLTAIVKNRLKTIQYRPALIDAFLAQTVLTLKPSRPRSKRWLRRVQLKDGDLGSLRRGEAGRGQHIFELLARPARANALLRIPHADDVQGPSPIAQWWRSSPAPVAPPRLMISACALS